ncbi:MAG: hypothetical protein K2J26_04700 [Ruminococcus sp.]|nr:hypothetical protein [Ruminococcus sp.]
MENTILRTSFLGYKKEDVLNCIDKLNLIVSAYETGNISKEYAENIVNIIMLIGMHTAFNGFNKHDTDKYLSELIGRITNKEYNQKYKPDYITPAKQFSKDTWKVLLAIFIVTASALYVLIFDGSEMPFVVSFMASIIILTLKAVKSWVNTIKDYINLKKSDTIPNKDKKKEILRTGIIIQTAILAFAVWFLGGLIYAMFGGYMKM